MTPERVGIVIVSHSPKVAEGTAELVQAMVGADVRVAHAGGDPAGGLGTDVARIQAALEAVLGPAGVAVLVDLGSARIASEMAIDLLPEDRRARVVICDAPLVEGAVIAATEAAGGGTLDEVRAAAEELSA